MLIIFVSHYLYFKITTKRQVYWENPHFSEAVVQETCLNIGLVVQCEMEQSDVGFVLTLCKAIFR